MSKYYYLISGLVDISIDDHKMPCSIVDFKTNTMAMLSSSDKKQMDLFYYKYDNSNLLKFLKKETEHIVFDHRGTLNQESLENLILEVKKDNSVFASYIPKYLIDFLQEYYFEIEIGTNFPLQDRLSCYYYNCGTHCSNDFIAQWFRFNLNISNILTALSCRKYNMDKSLYVIGTDPVSDLIRHSTARDFGLGQELSYFTDLTHIAEDPNLLSKEKKIDLLKWEWLEENTFFKTFDIEYLFAYLIKLEIVERWSQMDKVSGEAIFRKIIATLKKDSSNALIEFKKNNIK